MGHLVPLLPSEDPTWVPTVTGLKITDPNKVYALDFLHSITDTVHRFYMCRHSTCRAFSLNTCWAVNKYKTHFRCPRCGQQYRPWRQQPGYVPASHVWVVESKDKNIPDTLIMSVWPNTADDNWVYQMMELQAGLTEEDNLKSESDLLTDIASLVAPASARFSFEHTPLSAAARWEIDEAKRCQPHEEWDYSHLLDGFPSAQVPPVDDKTVVLEGQDLIRVIALSGLLQKKASSRL